jgi:biotin synthesis protein BioG
MEKFYLRMFGTKSNYLRNAERIPKRTEKSLHDELRWMYNRIMEQKEPGFKWDFAITSETDRIFPAKNMKDYWVKRPETMHISIPKPHFLFHEWNSLAEFAEWVKDQKLSEAFKAEY